MKIEFDDKNYRIHNKRNKKIIKKSLIELGAGRSVLIDAENKIIAGNGVYEQWGEKPVKIIETDGNELVIVKRIDLKTDDKKRKKLALIDNHACDTSSFNFGIINIDFKKEEREEWDLKEKGYFQTLLKNDEKFTDEKIPYPITIVVDKKDYDEWIKIKSELKETNDIKAFNKILKNYDK